MFTHDIGACFLKLELSRSQMPKVYCFVYETW